MLQFAVSDGTETPLWNNGVKLTNLMPGNPLYSGTTFLKDPGNQPTFTARLDDCARARRRVRDRI